MRLRWTEEAANDLERIADYLVQNTSGRAQGLIERIYDAAGSLLTLPDSGRPGKVNAMHQEGKERAPWNVRAQQPCSSPHRK